MHIYEKNKLTLNKKLYITTIQEHEKKNLVNLQLANFYFFFLNNFQVFIRFAIFTYPLSNPTAVKTLHKSFVKDFCDIFNKIHIRKLTYR